MQTENQTLNQNKKLSPNWVARETASIFNTLAISSRLVALAKFSLSLFALALIGLLILWPLTGSMDKKMKLNFANLQKGEAEIPTMKNPQFHGIDRENRPFTVFADSAIQEDSNTIKLININGDMPANEGWLSILADSGTIDIEKKQLELNGNVNIFSDKGYEFVTSKAHVDLAKSESYGDQPVTMHGPMGILHASGFTALEKEAKFIFKGRVDLTVYKKSLDVKNSKREN